ncbi:hypothetical protein [Noviherbaspirillum saxi]|uniref:hypothetical protein n=1 Tax=Noviherbaspirillum saxi TaxID=2320863 RepID=UPI0011C45FD1|nr:hypothetical protein [Noviherbaspirillum saxi]
MKQKTFLTNGLGFIAILWVAYFLVACGGGPDTIFASASNSSVLANSSTSVVTNETTVGPATSSASASITIPSHPSTHLGHESGRASSESVSHASSSSEAFTGLLEAQDASHIPASIQFVAPIGTPAYRTGQSFTVERSGWLTKVEIYLQFCSNISPEMGIEVRKGSSFSSPIVASGTTLSGILAQRGSISCTSALAPTYFTTVTVHLSNFQVKSGEIYSIWPTVPAGKAYGWVGSMGYQNGTFLEQHSAGPTILRPDIDASFKIFVTTPTSYRVPNET